MGAMTVAKLVATTELQLVDHLVAKKEMLLEFQSVG